MKRAVLVVIVAATATLSCKKPPEPTGTQSPFLPAPQPSAAAPAPTTPAPAPSPTQTGLPALQVTWLDPPEWKRSARPKPMRNASYVVPRAAGDGEDGEFSVTYFGPGQGGSIDANVDRWVKQFTDVPADRVRREDRKTNGLRAHFVEVPSGTFNANTMGHGGERLKKDFALLGAIVEAPSGVYFFKLTGPKKTVENAKKSFDALLASIKPA